MVATRVALGALTPPGRIRSHANLGVQTPQPIPEVEVPLQPLKVFEGVLYVTFTKEEIECSAQPFRFSLVLKFLSRWQSLDNIKGFCFRRWGLGAQLVISAMANPRSVFVRFSNEEDSIKGFSREASEIDGVPYCVFQWSQDYVEDQELSLVPVWIFLPGLPSNYYHESFLEILLYLMGNLFVGITALDVLRKVMVHGYA